MQKEAIEVLPYDDVRGGLAQGKKEFPIWRKKYDETAQGVLARIRADRYHTSDMLLKNISSMRATLGSGYRVESSKTISEVRQKVQRCMKGICVLKGDRRYIVIETTF